MADVNLSVAVTSSGVPKAIQDIEALRKKGLQTATAMTELASATARSMAKIQKASNDPKTTSSKSDFKATITATGKEAASLTKQLAELEAGYKRISQLNPNASAAQRLTMFGNGDLQRGMQMVALMEKLQGALNPNASADRASIANQQEQRRLETMNAQNRALAAQKVLSEAVWQRQLSGMQPVEAAQARLSRATQELATATRSLNAANTAAAKNGTPENYDRQAQAALRAARATNEFTTAKQGLVRATEQEKAAATKGRDDDALTSYPYFMLAGLATRAAQAIYGVAEASITATAQIERGFADVERTFEGSDAELASLQNRLTELSTETPVSVIDLSQIATLGNQLGVASADIQQFTTTIAQYTAVSGQSAEDAATAFGRISNLTGLAASEYSNLASAITYVARTTVATESTIQNTAKEISALSAGAGFSADAIVGLAGALSSLAIPPERARGALSLYFGALNSAVAEGGPKLEAFATLTGMTAENLGRMVRENKGQEVFTAFISGLSQLDTVAKTTALDTLGLSTIRVDQTMRALAQNVPLVTKSFEGANQAFKENTEIANQYAIIQETLDSKWKEFQNSVLNAAGALGESFAPAATIALQILTQVLVAADAIAGTPLGQAFAKMASAAALLIGALAALLGVLALTKASMVVLRFAVLQLGWEAATTGLKGWIAALITGDKATRAAALSTVGFGVAAEGASRKTKLLTAALNLLKVALPLIAITAAIALWDSLATHIEKVQNPSVRLARDLTGLKDALITDNPNAMALAVDNFGRTAEHVGGKQLSDFNASLLTAIQIQKQAETAFDSTNGAIDGQAFSLGETSKAWITNALKTQEDIADILDGHDAPGELWAEWWGGFGDTLVGGTGVDAKTADNWISRDDFAAFLEAGLDLPGLAAVAINDGEEAAIKAYDAWQKGFAKANPDLAGASELFGNNVLPDILLSVTDAYTDAAVEAAVAGNTIAETGVVAIGAAADFDELGNYIGTAVASGEAFAVTFSGVTGRLDDFRDAIQGAIQGYVGFDEVMQRAEDAASATAEALGKDVEPKPVDVSAFASSLGDATTEAMSFYSDIMTLAEGGNQSFALQLAELGPEARNILSGALALDPGSRAKLEEQARFAAFLASDAFKNALETEMSDSNEAYARIFQVTGDLGQVQSYIAAQVAGTGAEWERQWAINNPSLPLNVTPELVNPTEEQLAIYNQMLSGRITVTPVLTYRNDNDPRGTKANKYTDTATGASITLPASLDQKALSASLVAWQGEQKANPQDIAAKINTSGFNKDIDNWVAVHGPIRIKATVQPTLAPSDNLNGSFNVKKVKKDGGMAGYASGGYLRGPGTPTSDSIPIWASRNEYIQNAGATKFWGVDFMDSLNRKMLPASFARLLGAAAVSGNQGPTHVAHVSVMQNNPLTRDPLMQLREKSESLVAGIWGDGE